MNKNSASIQMFVTSRGLKTAAHKSDLNTTGLQHPENSLIFWMLLRKYFIKSAQPGSLALNYFKMYKVR